MKNLMLRQEDLEQFEDEPLEYIKKDLEGTVGLIGGYGSIDLRLRYDLFEVTVLSSKGYGRID